MGRGGAVVFLGGAPEKNVRLWRGGGPSRKQKKGGEFFYTI